MGGQNPIEHQDEAINREATQIADMLDSGDAQSATEALRRASFDYEPQDFNKLVTAVEFMEQPQSGADLVLEPVQSYQRLPYHDPYDARRHQGQRNKISESMVSMVEPDREGNLYRADIAITRTRVEQLSAVPNLASASEVEPLTTPNETPFRNGAELAEMLDSFHTDAALETLRRGSFHGDSGSFVRSLYAANNFEYKSQGGDLMFTPVSTNDNYYNRRNGLHGRNQDFWLRQPQYPVSDTVVSVVQPNYNSQSNLDGFLRADIAVISTSNEPLAAVRRPVD